MIWPCSCAGRVNTPLHPLRLEITGTQVIRITVHSGELTITEGATDGKLEITGSVQTEEAAELLVGTDSEGVSIQSPKSSSGIFGMQDIPVQLNLIVPAGRQVYLDVFDADVNISDYHGNVDLKALAGRFTGKGLSGLLSLKSNRGDISLFGSSGEVHVIGNYGILTLDQVRGAVDSSTIMGSILFTGPVGEGDSVHLETDHGPVRMVLSGDASAVLAVHSASGVVTCLLPGLKSAPNSCEGNIGAGQGKIAIRTVSGEARITQLP